MCALIGWSLTGDLRDQQFLSNPTVLVAAGIAAGFVYWLIAGWTAGFWKPLGTARDGAPGPLTRIASSPALCFVTLAPVGACGLVKWAWDNVLPALSAIIITRNEAKNIAACLESVAFCDERIVVDGGSSDETVAIAESCGAAVTTHAWAGFGPQKNVALSLARGDWVLSIDDGERYRRRSPRRLRRRSPRRSPTVTRCRRLSTFLGRTMRHSGWFPDYVLRLFRRENARFTDDLVHERVVCRGRIARLTVPLDHHPVLRLEDAVARADSYSTAGPRCSPPRAAASPS